MHIILDSSVESQKSTQSIDAPGKPEKRLITNKVTTLFSDPPCTPMTCASFPSLTAGSRIISITPVETDNINVRNMLMEIYRALRHWLQTRKETSIDLLSSSLNLREQDKLVEMLGAGEISAQLSSMGKSEIAETRFPGVWLIACYDARDNIQNRFIEITSVPQLMRSQPDDILDAYERMEALLVKSDGYG